MTPSLDDLLASGLVTAATRQEFGARMIPATGAPRFYDAARFARLEEVVAALRPDLPGYDAAGIAREMDRRLADGDGDGWRYDELPPDGEAYRTALDWGGEPTKERLGARLYEDLLAEITEIAASHPRARAAMGDLSFADARGWSKVGADEPEAWMTGPPLPPTGPEIETAGKPPMRTYPPDEVVDVIVVGTGAGGAPLLARLAGAGLRVIALEAGSWWNPAKDFATDERSQSKLFWNDERLAAGADPIGFGRNNSGTGVGGSTLHYTAYTPRPQADDLRLKSESGIGEDWPLAFEELEPYLSEVETFIGVSGPEGYPWGSPRSYPLPPLPINAAGQLMERACAEAGIRTSPAPNAALSGPIYREGIGWRHACTNRGFCQAGCSVGAKASTDVTYIPLALHHGAEVRPGSFLTRLERDDSGAVTGVVYLRDGNEERQRCGAVVLSLGAIETPRFLLMNDLGNASGQVGRNFMAHTGLQLWGEYPEAVFPWKGIPGALISEDTHRAPDADFAGGYLVQSLGVMPVTYASQVARATGAYGPGLARRMAAYERTVGINILGDCLPYSHNRLELSDEHDARGLPKPRIHFSAGENERRMTRHADRTMTAILEAVGVTDIWRYERYAHIIGTCRMGDDPGRSVVDRDGAVHDVPGLFISDNSTFPSALSVNPALTIMALSLRTADRFLERA